METLTKKTLTTKRGFLYTYYVSPAESHKPTIFLQHGFPDSAAQWEDLITAHLRPAGYGVVALDQLGYAGTSKPTDPAAYKLSEITSDLVDILDAEALEKVVALGHDWGSRTSSMLYNLHPERVAGLVLLNVGYVGVSTEPFDFEALGVKTRAAFGYDLGAYWKLFVAPDGARLFRENADVGFDVLHAPQSWLAIICTEGALRKVLETRGEGYDLKRRPYATEEMKKTFVDRIRQDGMEGPVCWYKSFVLGHQDGIGKPENNIVNVPTLYVGFEEDVVSRKAFINPSIEAGFLPQLTSVTLPGGALGPASRSTDLGQVNHRMAEQGLPVMINICDGHGEMAVAALAVPRWRCSLDGCHMIIYWNVRVQVRLCCGAGDRSSAVNSLAGARL